MHQQQQRPANDWSALDDPAIVGGQLSQNGFGGLHGHPGLLGNRLGGRQESPTSWMSDSVDRLTSDGPFLGLRKGPPMGGASGSSLLQSFSNMGMGSGGGGGLPPLSPALGRGPPQWGGNGGGGGGQTATPPPGFPNSMSGRGGHLSHSDLGLGGRFGGGNGDLNLDNSH